MRFANPAEVLCGRHLEAQRQGGLEARRLQYVGLGKFLDLFGGFLRTYNTYLYNELSVTVNTSAKDYWEERCHLVSPLGLLVAAGGSWEALGLSEGLLGGSWGPLGAILEPLGRVWGPLRAVLGPLGVVS